MVNRSRHHLAHPPNARTGPLPPPNLLLHLAHHGSHKPGRRPRLRRVAHQAPTSTLRPPQPQRAEINRPKPQHHPQLPGHALDYPPRHRRLQRRALHRAKSRPGHLHGDTLRPADRRARALCLPAPARHRARACWLGGPRLPACALARRADAHQRRQGLRVQPRNRDVHGDAAPECVGVEQADESAVDADSGAGDDGSGEHGGAG